MINYAKTRYDYKLDYPAPNTVVIGDDYHKDVMLGRINKMKTVLLTREFETEDYFKG